MQNSDLTILHSTTTNMMHGSNSDSLQTWQQLHSDPEILEQLQNSEDNEFQLQKRLRQQYGDQLVRLALTVHEYRNRAAHKFTQAQSLWLDRQALEQATSEVVARHKARRFSGFTWDFCCGIGADTIALGAHGDVGAVDIRLLNCYRTLWNAEAYGVADRVHPICADVADLPADNACVHIDPDRRAHGRGRAVRIEDYLPGLEQLRSLTQRFPGGAIKLSPAADFGGKFPETELELISVRGECKEATIWFGELAGREQHRATVLPSGLSIAADPLAAWPEFSPLRKYLYDPDPAVVRSGLLDVAADSLNLQRLDESEEYLTGDDCVDSPFVTRFTVLDELPHREKQLRQYFRTANFGQLEIKCRRIPVAVDQLRRRLKLSGQSPGVLIIARINGRARAVVCQRDTQSHA